MSQFVKSHTHRDWSQGVTLPATRTSGIEGRWLSASEFSLRETTGAWLHPDGRIYDLGGRDGGHGSTSREVLGFSGSNTVDAAETAGYIRITVMDGPPVFVLNGISRVTSAQLASLKAIVRQNESYFVRGKCRFYIVPDPDMSGRRDDPFFTPHSAGELVRELRNHQRIG